MANLVYTTLFFLLCMIVSLKGQDANSCRCAADFQPLGCWRDTTYNRTLPELLLTERDTRSSKWNGRVIQWRKWNDYIPKLVCRCAEAASKKGYKYFAIQFYGECWSGPNHLVNYRKFGQGKKKYCISFLYQKCPDRFSLCVGTYNHNFVYSIY